MDIYQYFRNLDKNTTLYFFIGIILIFLLLNGYTVITNNSFFSILITISIFITIYTYKKDQMESKLGIIKRYDKMLNLKHFKYLREDLKLVMLYNDLLPFSKRDKYDFVDSMKATNNMLKYYQQIKDGNVLYSQLLDLARDEHDAALNYLSTITKSLPGTMGIIDGEEYIQTVDITQLAEGVDKLKEILDQYLFEMMNMARIQYETQPTTNVSRPIDYDANDPLPAIKSNTFNLHYGFVEP